MQHGSLLCKSLFGNCVPAKGCHKACMCAGYVQSVPHTPETYLCARQQCCEIVDPAQVCAYVCLCCLPLFAPLQEPR